MQEQEPRREVLDFLRGLNEAWVRGRFAELDRYFHEDVVMMPPGAAEPVRGRGACVQSYVDFATQANVQEYTQSDEQVDLFGQTAVASYRFDITYRMGGSDHHDTGRDAFVLVRTPEGWRAVWRTMVLLADA